MVLADLDADGFLTLTLNRPRKKNAVNDWVFTRLIEELRRAKDNDKVLVVIITGAGDGSKKDYFCAGADLDAGFSPEEGQFKSGKGSYFDPTGVMMEHVISYPKPIVAAVNGPGVGVGMTLIPNCDCAFTVDHAFFFTPFAQLAVTPEFCSTVLFPRIMGPSLANEVILFGRRLSAQEALSCGFVSAILPAGPGFVDAVKDRLRPSLRAPHALKSLKLFKGLVKHAEDVDLLLRVHRHEMALLDARSMGGDKSEAMDGVRALLGAKQSNNTGSKL